jgi:glycosyltransferase involved in cell wall biosynthesis
VHIMQLTDLYYPVIGGLERHVATLSREFQRRGHRVTVVTLRADGLPAEEIIDEVRVLRIRSLSQRLSFLYASRSHPFHPTAPDPGAVAALRQVIGRERPDVVHSHSWIQYSYFPLHHAHKGPAHVVTLHDYGLACPRKTLQPAGQAAPCTGPAVAKCLSCAPEQYGVVRGTAIAGLHRGSKVLHHRADRYLAVSGAVALRSAQVLPADKEIIVVPSMIPDGVPALAAATPRPAFLPEHDGYLLFIGALGPHKGVDVLLDAHRRMRHRVPLVLIGTPRPDTPPLTRPDVIAVSNVPHAQAMAAMRGASVAIVPSTWHEPMAQVAVEAMVLGRPVVGSDVGGLRDLVQPGLTGIRVPPGEPVELAAAVDSLLDDPDLRERLGAGGRQLARGYEASAVTPRILDVFGSALRERAMT